MAEPSRTSAKTMRLEFHLLDQALSIWFRQQQEAKVKVNCKLLAEKAKMCFEELYPDHEKSFMASSGFIWRLEKQVTMFVGSHSGVTA